MIKTKYGDLIGKVNEKGKDFLYSLRKKMVFSYLDGNNGGEKVSYDKIACDFQVNRKTVMKWVSRYKEFGLEGLFDQSKKAMSYPNKMSIEEEEEIIRLRKQTGFGSRRLKMEFDIKRSPGSISRVLRDNGLLNSKRKRKHHKKANLRAIKELLKPFNLIQMDLKCLWDMPKFYPFYHSLSLPRYQISLRDVKSGAVHMFYTYEKSVSSCIAAVDIVLSHLKRHGIDISKTEIQTDNGSEFSGIRINMKRGFTAYLKNAWEVNHKFIPPGCPNANADVEAYHRLVEDEFYEREVFDSKMDFLSKAFSYNLYFNIERKNSYRKFKTPLDYIEEENMDPRTLVLKPFIIDKLMNNNVFCQYMKKNFSFFLPFYYKKLTVHHLTKLDEYSG